MISGCSNTLNNINILDDDIDPIVIEFSKNRINLNNVSFINKQCELNQTPIPQKNKYYVRNKVIFDIITAVGIY